MVALQPKAKGGLQWSSKKMKSEGTVRLKKKVVEVEKKMVDIVILVRKRGGELMRIYVKVGF